MNKRYIFFLSFCLIVLVVACEQSFTEPSDSQLGRPSNIINKPAQASAAAAIMAREQIPVLCYHQIRDWRSSDSESSKDYIVPIATFKGHLKMLADSGFRAILPDQLYAYLTKGASLPPKPILITFDDTDVDQFNVARPELEKYGFKATFFIMTVCLGRKNYMSKDQIKILSKEGHTIGGHTWDHHNFKKYKDGDWVIQLQKPIKTLEELTGKKLKYFAYPFGLWNRQGIPELKKYGIIAAFQLASKRDSSYPLFTIRRIIASGYWSRKTLYNNIMQSFKP